ncbi:hypothetical protein HQ531_14775, partial [bacterium]|nr:hypothetical protein [bacterium]
ISVRTLRRLLRDANIDLYKIGSRVKVKESDLEMLISRAEEDDEMDKYL